MQQPGEVPWVGAKLDQVDAHVGRYGLMVQGVEGKTVGEGFQYTVGMTGKGLPELAVFGFHRYTGGPLLHIAVHRLRRRGRDLMRAGRRFDLFDAAGGGVVRARLRAPSKWEREESAPGVAYAYYQRVVPWLVLALPGWPCASCTPCDQDAECGCVFACGWIHCERPDK